MCVHVFYKGVSVILSFNESQINFFSMNQVWFKKLEDIMINK